MRVALAAVAPLALKLDQFFAGKHINLQELESLISLLRRITREGIRARWFFVLVDSRVVLGSRLKETIELTKNQFLASKKGLVNPADAPPRSKPIKSWFASLPKLPPTPTAVFASAHTLSRSWIYSVNHCRLLPIQRDVRELESSGAFSFSEAKPACVETSTSQVTFAGEGISTPSNVRQLLRKGVRTVSKDEKAERAVDCSSHQVGPAVIPSSLLEAGSVHRLNSLCLWDQNRITMRVQTNSNDFGFFGN